MNLRDDILTINGKADNKELSALAKEILEHIDTIKEIVVSYEDGIESSALFSLLYSIRKTNPDINIPFLAEVVKHINGIGSMSLDIRG